MVLMSITYAPGVAIIRRYECGGSAARLTHFATAAPPEFGYDDLDYFRCTPHSDYAVKTAYPVPAPSGAA